MKYIGLRLSSLEEISSLEKKEYIDSLYDNHHMISNERKEGFMNKFSKAMGYKYIEYHHEDYECRPSIVLFNHFYTYPYGNVIGDFYVDNIDTISAKGNHLYNNKEMLIKLGYFFKKIFPELEVSFFEKDELPNRKVWLESFTFKSIEIDYRVTIECSLSKPLNEEEVEAVKKVVSLFKDLEFKFKVLCFECETCKSNDPEAPYHFSIEYDYNHNSYRKTEFLYHNNLNYEQKCFYCAGTLSKTEKKYNQDTCGDCRKKTKKQELFAIN